MTKDLAYQVRYTGAGYLDDKMNPVANVSELNSKFDSTELVKGMTVTVIDDGEGNMADFVWDGSQWVKKQVGETYEAGQYIKIENNVISVTGITPDSYATKEDLNQAVSGLATVHYVDESLSEKADSSAITEFVTSGEVETLVENIVTGLTPTQYEAGANISIENNVISVTGISTEEFATKDELTAATSTLASKDELVIIEQDMATKEDLELATSGLASECFVIEKINEATISGATYQAGANISIEHNVISVTGISTEEFATKDELTALTQTTSDELTAITAQTAELLAGKSDTGHVHDDRYYTESEIDELLAGKADTGETGQAYSAGTNISIDNYVISVTGLTNGVLTRDIVTQVNVGFVPSGTTFVAGTPFETIFRSIFMNASSNMILVVNLESSDGSDITYAAPQVTVNQETKTWEGSPLSFLLADGVNYEISVSNIGGYAHPSNVTGVAVASEITRSVTMTYVKQVNKKYLSYTADFDELMILMDDGIIADEPVDRLYPTNFTQPMLAQWNQGVASDNTIMMSGRTQDDVNVIAVAVPKGYLIGSIIDENQAQEIINLFYVQDVDMVVNNTPYGKIYSRTVEGGLGTFVYSFNIVAE